jgi:hypothetical protein
LTPQELHVVGLTRYGTPRYLAAMSRDTGIPYRTLLRYRNGESPIKPLASHRIRGLGKSSN